MNTKKRGGTMRTARKKKKKRTSLFLLKLVVFLGLVYAALFHTPLLTVNQVTVGGNSVVDAQSIIDASGVQAGQNMLKISKKRTQAAIEKIAYVSTADMQYKWPGRIHLQVAEGKIMANVRFPGGYASVDRNLKVLEINAQPRSFPVIEGINIQKSVVGEKLTIDETDKFDIILVYVNILEQRGQLPLVHVFRMEGYELHLDMASGVKVNCGGRADAEYKLSALMESFKSEKEPTIGTFDVTNPKRVVYSID